MLPDPEIIYEDNHLLVVNKRAGDLVQGDQTGDQPLVEHLKEYLVKKYNKPGAAYLGVVHRLDRPTSGVLVFAKTSKALSRLNAQFAEGSTHKMYWALVNALPNQLEKGELIHWLVRNPKQNKSYAYSEKKKDAKEARLRYTVRKKLNRYYWLEIELITGRHHQIRAQLAACGCWIKGDLKYGAKRSNPDAGISLHARSLEILHPVKKEPIRFEAQPPSADVWSEG